MHNNCINHWLSKHASLCERKRCRAQRAGCFVLLIQTDLRDLLCDSREVINISSRRSPFLTRHVSRTRSSETRFLADLKNSARQCISSQIGLDWKSTRVFPEMGAFKPLLVPQKSDSRCFGEELPCVNTLCIVKLLAITFSNTFRFRQSDEFQFTCLTHFKWRRKLTHQHNKLFRSV
ncbi:Hypothetical_protein [Hexamita inflata]|uniref:Hypothetical_protein n=1 Tax=Hexamita inflata TaxID=28002 RepID=A0AA86QWA0_9EUKA|nr:Hypothetical protein HINF_LOCUS50201 [Hexamita inflata]CAI9962558.1 Hypothetical protein HINF_LOCUS50203 [Hexamita inflata]